MNGFNTLLFNICGEDGASFIYILVINSPNTKTEWFSTIWMLFKESVFIFCNLKEPLPALFHTDELYFSIGRTCCAGVDSVTDRDYNNYIEDSKNVLKKVQSAFCPLLALF